MLRKQSKKMMSGTLKWKILKNNQKKKKPTGNYEKQIVLNKTSFEQRFIEF